MGDEARAYMLRPGEGRPTADGRSPARLKAGNAETGGAFHFYYNETTSGGPGTPLHIHHREDECVLLLEGEGVAFCGGQRFHLTPGCFIYLPRGVPHAIRYLTATKRVTIVSPSTQWEQTTHYIEAEVAKRRSYLEIFGSLPPETGMELIGPFDWSVFAEVSS